MTSEHGWLEGENLLLEWRYTTGTEPDLPDIAAEFVRVDLRDEPQVVWSVAERDVTHLVDVRCT